MGSLPARGLKDRSGSEPSDADSGTRAPDERKSRTQSKYRLEPPHPGYKAKLDYAGMPVPIAEARMAAASSRARPKRLTSRPA